MIELLEPTQRERAARAAHPRATTLEKLWLAPWKAMETPDPWQEELLRQIVTYGENELVLCSRQIGKSESVAAAAYLEACFGGFVLVLSPSDEQSKEFLDRVLGYEKRLKLVGRTVEPNKHELRLRSGGRVLALPNNEKTVRCRSAVDLLVIDEASRVPDALFGAVSPMLAVSGGHTVLLSTPFGRRGFFYKEWTEGDGWQRHRHPWYDCPRLTPAFIEAERRKHGSGWVAQEYLDCAEGEEFVSVESSVFNSAEYAALVDPTLETVTWQS